MRLGRVKNWRLKIQEEGKTMINKFRAFSMIFLASLIILFFIAQSAPADKDKYFNFDFKSYQNAKLLAAMKSGLLPLQLTPLTFTIAQNGKKFSTNLELRVILYESKGNNTPKQVVDDKGFGIGYSWKGLTSPSITWLLQNPKKSPTGIPLNDFNYTSKKGDQFYLLSLHAATPNKFYVQKDVCKFPPASSKIFDIIDPGVANKNQGVIFTAWVLAKFTPIVMDLVVTDDKSLDIYNSL